MSGRKQRILTAAAVAVLAAAGVVIALVMRNRTKLSTPVTNTNIGMGTVVVQSLYSADTEEAQSAVSCIGKLINDLDTKRLSWREEGSDVYHLNHEHSSYVDYTTFDCISQCFEVSSKCNGFFDITVGKLSTLWGIGTEDARVPEGTEISEAVGTIDYKQVALLPDGKGSFLVETGEEQMIDLGAVGKGLACDKIRDYLEETDIRGGTVSVGGSILAYGKNPSSKDGSWNIGIRDPLGGDSDYIAVLNCGSCCISTSGDYEKVLYGEDGKKYHHILNPKTGYPAESNVMSVTVVADSGLITDALSTACFILGWSDDSQELLKEYHAEAVFIGKDKQVHITSGLQGKVTMTGDSYEAAE